MPLLILSNTCMYVCFQTLSNLIKASEKNPLWPLENSHGRPFSAILNLLKSCWLWTTCNLSHPVVTDILLGLGLHRQQPLAAISLAAYTPPRKVDLIVKAFESSAFSLGLWRRWCDGRRISWQDERIGKLRESWCFWYSNMVCLCSSFWTGRLVSCCWWE